MARPPLTPITWVGSARADLKAAPPEVQDVVGLALLQAQLGGIAPQAKRLKGDLSGVVEIVADVASGTYRAVYTAKLAGRLYVLHVFQKKSTRGIATPKHEIELIKARLRWARWHHTRRAAGRLPEEE
ncbi:MAG: type II toxin-antitoxin system RelE/ParE family toxin [Gemmatimonadales bacterium]|nr:type II toxin-antitoxin system RelE/ParE family toxin [Gemmatimonadales bacterium]